MLDRRLEALRRLLPDAPTPAADLATLRETAAATSLSIEATLRTPVESHDLGFVVAEATGTGRFTDVDRFFRQLALHPRPIDVESLSLKATPDELVRLSTVVRFAFRPKKAPLPAPPLGPAPQGAVPKPQLQAFSRDQALALAKSEALSGLRRARRNPRLFLAELGAIARDRPVVFTEATLAERFEVRGLTLGEATSRALEARFERGFFRVQEFLMARQGACRRFEVKGTSPIAGPAAELPLPVEDPFLQDDSPCRVDRDATQRAAIQAGATGSRASRGALTLRLRDVDLADVFSALHRLTRRSFLVDGDVAGRVDVDVVGASLDEVFQAMRKNGLRVLEGPALARVSTGPAPGSRAAAEPLTGAGDPAKRASFELKREGVREILAVMTDVDPELAALGPRGFLGRVSLWAGDVPVAEVRGALLRSVGLDERIEEGRRFLRWPSAAEDELVPVAGAPPQRRLALDLGDIEVQELALAGLGNAGEGYLAFAYLPTGRLAPVKPGDKLADAVVRVVGPAEVEFDTDEGALRLQLPPPR